MKLNTPVEGQKHTLNTHATQTYSTEPTTSLYRGYIDSKVHEVALIDIGMNDLSPS